MKLNKLIHINFFIDGSQKHKMCNIDINKVYRDFIHFISGYNSVYKVICLNKSSLEVLVYDKYFYNVIKNLPQSRKINGINNLVLEGYIECLTNSVFITDINLNLNINISNYEFNNNVEYAKNILKFCILIKY